MVDQPNKKKKTFGLALGGGGARGFAHIGILEVLEREGIKPDHIAGTSMGAVMGAMYAVGIPLEKIKAIALNFENIKLEPARYLNLLHESILKNDFIIEALEQIFEDKKFEDCKIPFCSIAVDLESGREVVFNKGLLKKALQASVSIPIIFPPTFYEDRYLIDGGMLNNVPLNCLKCSEGKIDVTIGVKIINYTSRQYISGMVYAKYHQQKYQDLFKQKNYLESFLNSRKNDLQLLAVIGLRAMDIAAKDSTDERIKNSNPDILLEPNIQCGLLEFEKAKDAIEEGRKAMEAELPKLKKLLEI